MPHILPVDSALQVVEQTGVALPFHMRSYMAHALPNLQAVVLELDDLNASVDQVLYDFADRDPELAHLVTEAPKNFQYQTDELAQPIEGHPGSLLLFFSSLA